LRELTIDNKVAACYSSPGYTIEARVPSGTNDETADNVDNELAGTAGGELFSADGGDIFKLLYLYVAPAYRGMGLSRLLLDRVSETAKRLEAKELVVDVPSGSAFLERELRERGFSEYVRSYSLRWSRFE
jgi:GNAT superfamily N-acetyltransferase